MLTLFRRRAMRGVFGRWPGIVPPAFLLAVLVAALLASPALAAAPAQGTVYEGQSVPGGVALGDTRAQVEAAYNANGQDGICYGLVTEKSFCEYAVDGGGQIFVHYRGADGGIATNSPGDILYKLTWSVLVDGWFTTAGINTSLALANQQAAVDAYPNARLTYNQWGHLYLLQDFEQGIEIQWPVNFYTGTFSVSMSIFFPQEPPPLVEKTVRVVDIDLSIDRRSVIGFVLVRNQYELAAEDALVTATWTLPDGSTQEVLATTSGAGYAYFKLDKARRGTYTLTIKDVTLDGYRFDKDNSLLSASITKNKG